MIPVLYLYLHSYTCTSTWSYTCAYTCTWTYSCTCRRAYTNNCEMSVPYHKRDMSKSKPSFWQTYVK